VNLLNLSFRFICVADRVDYSVVLSPSRFAEMLAVARGVKKLLSIARKASKNPIDENSAHIIDDGFSWDGGEDCKRPISIEL
jgi:hypothetical protein